MLFVGNENSITYREPPRPFVKRQQVAPLPPRPVILKRLPLNPLPVRIVRRVEHLGVIRADPQAYLARYGSSLLDSSTLERQARSIGIIEDISIPVRYKNFIDIFIPS